MTVYVYVYVPFSVVIPALMTALEMLCLISVKKSLGSASNKSKIGIISALIRGY